MDGMKTAGVYAITNTLSGKRYIGSSKNIKTRLRKHYAALRRGAHHSIVLQRAWDKYGAEAFSSTTLLYCNIDMLETYEQICLDNLLPEYNSSKSAASPVARGTKLPQKTVEKITASVKARYATGWKAEHPPRTQEYREQMSTIVIDRWNDSAYKKRVKRSMSQAFSTDTIRTMRSNNAKQLWEDPEYRAKATAARKGKAYNIGYKCTLEQIENRRRAGRISNAKKKLGTEWQCRYAELYPEYLGDISG